jgi:hypothetical protein
LVSLQIDEVAAPAAASLRYITGTDLYALAREAPDAQK